MLCAAQSAFVVVPGTVRVSSAKIKHTTAHTTRKAEGSRRETLHAAQHDHKEMLNNS